jgi:hypothetical protein
MDCGVPVRVAKANRLYNTNYIIQTHVGGSAMPHKTAQPHHLIASSLQPRRRPPLAKPPRKSAPLSNSAQFVASPHSPSLVASVVMPSKTTVSDAAVRGGCAGDGQT